MKHTITLILFILLLSFKTNDAEKKFTATERQLGTIQSAIINTAKYINTSNLPHQDVLNIETALKQAMDSIDVIIKTGK